MKHTSKQAQAARATEAGSKCKECAIWREVIVMLIGQLPTALKTSICARLATIPGIWKQLTPEDKAQANLINAIAGAPAKIAPAPALPLSNQKP